MKICAKCGSHNIVERKQIVLQGQPWWIWDDGYRFWVQPAEGNPAIDREPHIALEYKHFDYPQGLPELLFGSLIDQARGSGT